MARSADGLTVTEIKQWIDNDEGLYNWWKSSRQTQSAFIRDNRQEIVTAINRVLNPAPKRGW